MTIVTTPDAFQAALIVESGKTLAAIQDAVRGFAAPLGYDRFVLFSASAGRGDAVKRIYWIEGDWFGDGQAVDPLTYVRRCPVTRHILEAREPFFWTKVTDGSRELYRVVPSPRGRGLHGLQVPVFGPRGLEGAMSLGGERIETSHRARLSLSVVATAAFLAARKLLEGSTGTATRALSGREREVLLWTAAGRRQTDIAATLGLSQRTVENHLRRARRRLGASTTAQAIRVAIETGDIEG